MASGLRDLMVVGKYDWVDSYHSRRTALWLILYLIGSLSACFIFVFIIQKMEAEIAQAVNLGVAQKAGAMTSAWWETDTFREMVTGLVGDEDLARSLINTPLLALFFGWISLAFAPILVILVCSESISTEVASGSARFSLFRTARLPWCLGKAAGHAFLLLLGIVLSGAGAWIIGQFWMAQFEPVKTAGYLGIFVLRAWVYSLPFLGLGFAVSQWTRSVQLSRALGILLYFATFILFHVAEHYAGAGIAGIWDGVLLVLPQGHRIDFWHPGLAHQVSAALFCVALGFGYFFAGYAVFARRDL